MQKLLKAQLIWGDKEHSSAVAREPFSLRKRGIQTPSGVPQLRKTPPSTVLGESLQLREIYHSDEPASLSLLQTVCTAERHTFFARNTGRSACRIRDVGIRGSRREAWSAASSSLPFNPGGQAMRHILFAASRRTMTRSSKAECLMPV